MQAEKDIVNMAFEMERELKENILEYWISHSPDQKYGGFAGHINSDNTVEEHAPKGAVLNARILWTFSAAYILYRDNRYLEMAERAFSYIREHFIDREYGGVYWELDYSGKPRNSRKQIYALAFVIYAMTEYHMATSDREALDIAKNLFHLIEEKSFDREKNGYLEALGRTWKPLQDLRLSKKDANESKTMNTHLHILEAYANLYRVWKDRKLADALQNVLLLFAEKFLDTRSYHVNMFFDDDWNLKSDLISYGHDIETSWLMLEGAEILGNDALIELVKPLSVNIARVSLNALDHQHGLINEAFPSRGEIDTDRHWWHQAEAIVGYYNAYEVSGDARFAHEAVLSWNFTNQYIIDHTLGEWFWKVNKDGNPCLTDEKAGFWKCPYHNSRACMEIIKRTSKQT
ncbi:MAG: AGE family epimerase/isomerase [Bacteroidota bacterium]